MREVTDRRGIETEVGSTSEFEDEVLSTIRAKERGSAFTDIAAGRVDIASQIWADFDTNFSKKLDAITSPDLDQAVDAWSETQDAITRRSSSDTERVAAWLAMCAEDIKKVQALANLKSSDALPENLNLYMSTTMPQFTQKGVQEGNVSADMRHLAEAKPSTVDMLLETLSVNQERDGIGKGDSEYQALFENIQHPGGKVWGNEFLNQNDLTDQIARYKHSKGSIGDMEVSDRRLYKTSVPSFILEVSRRDLGSKNINLRWVKGHYILPKRFEQMKEQQGK